MFGRRVCWQIGRAIFQARNDNEPARKASELTRIVALLVSFVPFLVWNVIGLARNVSCLTSNAAFHVSLVPFLACNAGGLTRNAPRLASSVAFLAWNASELTRNAPRLAWNALSPVSLASSLVSLFPSLLWNGAFQSRKMSRSWTIESKNWKRCYLRRSGCNWPA